MHPKHGFDYTQCPISQGGWVLNAPDGKQVWGRTKAAARARWRRIRGGQKNLAHLISYQPGSMEEGVNEQHQV